jgi:hypothetical protein
MTPKVMFCDEKDGFCDGLSAFQLLIKLFMLIDLRQNMPLEWCGFDGKGGWGGVSLGVRAGQVTERSSRRARGSFGSWIRGLAAQWVSKV